MCVISMLTARTTMVPTNAPVDLGTQETAKHAQVRHCVAYVERTELACFLHVRMHDSICQGMPMAFVSEGGNVSVGPTTRYNGQTCRTSERRPYMHWLV